MSASFSVKAQTTEKPKLLILTDIGGDPDDQQSMVRLMAYNNEFDIVGLVATSRMGHGQDTKPGLITDIINAYGQSYTNFSTHASGYATVSQLSSVVASGTSAYNPNNISSVIGSGKSTAGSNLIINAVDSATNGQPVNISIWGGAADLAQALYDVRATRSAAEVNTFVSRIRVYAITDQDGAGSWINTNFSTLTYIVPNDVTSPTTGKTLSQSASFRGMYQNSTRADNGTDGRQVVPTDELGLTKRAWVDANVHGHGALGDMYPVTGVWQGPTGSKFPNNSSTEGVKEGDSVSWLYLLSNGLNMPDHINWGGWGGRYEASADNPNLYLSARDKHWSGKTDIALETVWTVARWREAVQNDFAARMDWATASDYDDANHAPVSPLEGLFSYSTITTKDGLSITLSGEGWSDPDGDTLNYRWWFYADASTLGVLPTYGDVTQQDLTVLLPSLQDKAQLHFILEVTDQPDASGVAMTRYQRYVIDVDPNAVPEPATATIVTGGLLFLKRPGKQTRKDDRIRQK